MQFTLEKLRVRCVKAFWTSGWMIPMRSGCLHLPTGRVVNKGSIASEKDSSHTFKNSQNDLASNNRKWTYFP